MSLLKLAQALENSGPSLAMRESIYWFPSLTLLHLLALLIAGGTIVFWDLRLLGVGLRHSAVSRVAKSLLPWTWGGFALLFVTGSLLVVMEAGRLYNNIFFRIKVASLILAGINVLVFHLTIFRNVDQWEEERVTPLRARMAGGLSLFLWFCIMAAGRAIGYTLDYAA